MAVTMPVAMIVGSVLSAAATTFSAFKTAEASKAASRQAKAADDARRQDARDAEAKAKAADEEAAAEAEALAKRQLMRGYRGTEASSRNFLTREQESASGTRFGLGDNIG